MMKRSRSFVSILIVLLSMASVPVGLTVKPQEVHAGGVPRVMDPRAGDPTEPSDGLLPDRSTVPDPSDPQVVQHDRPSALAANIQDTELRRSMHAFLSLLRSLLERW